MLMKFTSEADLLRLNPRSAVYPLIESFVNRLITEVKKSEFGYSPEADGYLVYLDDPSDTNRPLTDIWGDDAYCLIDVPWESVMKDETDQFYICVYLANNQWGLVIILPDADWLDSELRECLEYHRDP